MKKLERNKILISLSKVERRAKERELKWLTRKRKGKKQDKFIGG
jgi:hypothetical protein